MGRCRNRHLLPRGGVHIRYYDAVLVPLAVDAGLGRKVFFFLDDVFYGKKPKPKKGPEWVKYY